MSKYDVETLLFDVQALLSANLNTKIAAINTEKGDSITLKNVDSSAYFLQELNGPPVNLNPFILYGEEKIDAQYQTGNHSKVVTISVVIVVVDEGEDGKDVITKRMLRYRRALEEVIEDSFQLVGNANILMVQSLPAYGFKIDEGNSYRAIGINIVTGLA
jgi:hypothetical protein